jgi:hypothetical protein
MGAAAMSREPRMNPAMAASMLGLQQEGAESGAFVIALVMYTLSPWQPPTERELERARQTAARFKLSEDLAVFLPREPGRFAGRARKDEYRGLVIALKRIDEIEGSRRAEVIAEVHTLLGRERA